MISHKWVKPWIFSTSWWCENFAIFKILQSITFLSYLAKVNHSSNIFNNSRNNNNAIITKTTDESQTSTDQSQTTTDQSHMNHRRLQTSHRRVTDESQTTTDKSKTSHRRLRRIIMKVSLNTFIKHYFQKGYGFQMPLWKGGFYLKRKV